MQTVLRSLGIEGILFAPQAQKIPRVFRGENRFPAAGQVKLNSL